MTEGRERELRSLVSRIATTLVAERIVVWEVHADGLSFAFGYFAPQSAIFHGLEVWQRHQDLLRRGRVIEDAGYTYHPVTSSSAVLVAVVQSAPHRSPVEEPPHLDAHDHAYLEQRLRSLASLLCEGEEPEAPAADVVMYTAAQLERAAGRRQIRARELLLALRRQAWNIRAVARMHKVTPQTIRNWMRATGVKRAVPSPFDPRPARDGTR